MPKTYLKPQYFDDYSSFIPDYEQFELAQAKLPPIVIRRNTLKTTKESFEHFLNLRQNEGLLSSYFELENLKDCYQVEAERAVLGGLIEHHLGLFYIQGASSVLPVVALAPQAHEHILDLCAAPGGKTTLLSEMMSDTGALVANEPSLGRRRVLKANLDRIGAVNTMITSYKGELFPTDRLFDAILLDGPCSAEGSLRGSFSKSFDYERNETYRHSLRLIQAKLLRHAVKLLKPNGRLVYSTCTYDVLENEMQVQRVLQDCPELQLKKIAIDGPWISGLTQYKDQEFHPSLNYTIRVYPHRFNSWGFYVASFVKA